MSEVTVPPRRDGGIARTRDLPLFAELRRVTTWAPSTDTLPSTIPLQATDEARVVTIGREGSDVILDARESIERILSRKHAEIAFDPETGAHTVNDLDTLNGTYHNGNLLSRGPLVLQHGDIIGFGGPTTVVPPDNTTLKNPFRYQYWRTRPFAEWKILEAETRSSPSKRAKIAASVSGDAEARRVHVRDDDADAIEQAAVRAANARQTVVALSTRPSFVAQTRIDAARGSTRRSRAASSRPRVRAVSRGVKTSTACHRCGVVIPPLFLRIERTTSTCGVSTVEYFHANTTCLRSLRREIVDIILSRELTEQEKRVTSGVIARLSSPA